MWLPPVRVSQGKFLSNSEKFLPWFFYVLFKDFSPLAEGQGRKISKIFRNIEEITKMELS